MTSPFPRPVISPPLCTLLLASVVACTPLGPNFREPEMSWLSAWQPDLYGQTFQDPNAVDISQWWQRLGDPILNELIAVARYENPDLQIAGLRILESRAALGIAVGLQFPQLQHIDGAGAYVSEYLHGGRDDDHRDYGTADLAFNLQWEMDFWGRFCRGIESADAAFFASIANQRDGQVLLAAEVATRYYDYKTTLQRIDIARRNIALQERNVAITRQLFESGQQSELDLQQARTQYLATLATVPALELTLTRQRNALSALLGRTPGDLPELAGVDDSLPQIGQIPLGQMPVSLLLRRPDVRAAAWEAASQSAQIGIAMSDLYPAISLFGSVGWAGTSLGELPDVSTLIAGPALRWNIFNYGRIKNNVRVQDARLQQRLEIFRATVLQAAREIDDAASAIAQTGARQGILDESLVAAERSLEIATRRYQEGYSDFQRVLDAQAAVFAQSDLVVINRGDHVAAIIELYRSIGGGWRQATVEDLFPADTRYQMQQRSNWGEQLEEPLPALPAGATP
ncbi:efflux transporter outer membrane subunit [uncultured Microbulbifer sp.]|uniref:efflux transporter outer membrane subunit n=1 Tax=uncultured Microbulbifer sp. TaxID=348147 RepID=UPI0025FCF355|nr:efflux transporter outer membrane subunit [uncultured Microbulbifer sp.]